MIVGYLGIWHLARDRVGCQKWHGWLSTANWRRKGPAGLGCVQVLGPRTLKQVQSNTKTEIGAATWFLLRWCSHGDVHRHTTKTRDVTAEQGGDADYPEPCPATPHHADSPPAPPTHPLPSHLPKTPLSPKHNMTPD